MNSLDPRGQPFKLRIINMILQLRASVRDPLVAKINEVCSVYLPEGQSSYIDVNELELNLATKSSNKRAASMDVRQARNGGGNGSSERPSSKNGSDSKLPDIGGAGGLSRPRGSVDVNQTGMLPSLNKGASLSLNQASTLPHSEPLSEE